MFYFIPSWYNPSRQWYDDTPTWSRVYDKMEFDDTINQLKMFQQAQEKCALLVMSYRPLASVRVSTGQVYVFPLACGRTYTGLWTTTNHLFSNN